jgi:hypothetical protein
MTININFLTKDKLVEKEQSCKMLMAINIHFLTKDKLVQKEQLPELTAL